MKSLTDLAGDLDVSTEQVLTSLRIVAVRAEVDEVAQWAAKELEGYDEEDELPAYRSWRLSIVASLHRPGQGMMTNVDVPSTAIPKKLRDKATIYHCRDGVGRLEEMLSEVKGEPLAAEHPDLTGLISAGKFLGPGVSCVQAVAKFSPAHLGEIVTRARQTALKLCLECEARGIELTFAESTDSTSSQERKAWLETLKAEGTRAAMREGWALLSDWVTKAGGS